MKAQLPVMMMAIVFLERLAHGMVLYDPLYAWLKPRP